MQGDSGYIEPSQVRNKTRAARFQVPIAHSAPPKVRCDKSLRMELLNLLIGLVWRQCGRRASQDARMTNAL